MTSVDLKSQPTIQEPNINHRSIEDPNGLEENNQKVKDSVLGLDLANIEKYSLHLNEGFAEVATKPKVC